MLRDLMKAKTKLPENLSTETRRVVRQAEKELCEMRIFLCSDEGRRRLAWYALNVQKNAAAAASSTLRKSNDPAPTHLTSIAENLKGLHMRGTSAPSPPFSSIHRRESERTAPRQQARRHQI